MVILGLPENMQHQMLNFEINTKEELRSALERLKPVTRKAEFDKKKSHTESRTIVNQNKKLIKNVFPVQNEEYLEEDINAGQTSFIASLSNSRKAMVDLLVNKFKCKGLFDTGADLTLMSKSFFTKNGFKSEPAFHILTGFNNCTSETTEKVLVKIEFDSKQLKTEAYVIDGLLYDLIICYEDLRRLQLKWDFEKSIINQCKYITVTNKEDVLKHFPKICEDKSPKYEVPFKLKDDAELVQFKPFRLSREKTEWLKYKIVELKSRGFIVDSKSEFASPCVVTPKEDGNLRLCQDSREINKQTVLDPFPFPIIDDVINNLGGCKVFSKLDLKDGFHLIGLTPETRKYTAFVTPFGHYEYTRLPFGWKNSPPVFQRIMVQVLGPLLNDTRIAVYVDDIICGGDDEEDCGRRTALILKRLNDAGLRLNFDKSIFNEPQVTFLGRVIDGKTKTTKEESIEKVRSIQRPNDITSLRKFTGLTGHFRTFIPNYVKIVRPLYRLKQKDTPFIWDKNCEESFNVLKGKITSNPVLQLPDWKLGFELCTDASGYGTGAILYQRDKTVKKSHQLRVIG